jgi:hypothetical protein
LRRRDIDVHADIAFPEEVAAEESDSQDDDGNDQAAHYESQAARRTLGCFICHG